MTGALSLAFLEFRPLTYEVCVLQKAGKLGFGLLSCEHRREFFSHPGNDDPSEATWSQQPETENSWTFKTEG